MNHTICDSLGLVQFLKMVSQFSTNSPVSLYPVWHRHLLSSRHPPRITRLHQEYHEPHLISNPSNPPTQTHHNSIIFIPNQITKLRNRLPHHLQNCSVFELLTACLWKCRTEALNLNPSEIVSISPFITAHGKQGLDFPEGYYGNAFVFPTAISQAGLICKNPLSYALELIRGAKAEMNREYLNSVTDFLVVNGRPMYRRNGNFLVADSTQVGFERLDFGWGKPVYGGPAGAIPNVSFYCAFKNVDGENCIVVPILLPGEAMNRFVSQVQKMTSEKDLDESCSYGPDNRVIKPLSKF